MQNLSIKKQYSIAALIQVIALTLFFAITKFILNNESVILNPIPYFIMIWAFISIIDGAVLIFFIFRGKTIQNNVDIKSDEDNSEENTTEGGEVNVSEI